MPFTNIFTPGNVLFIPNFDFNDGDDLHDKLLIILHTDDDDGSVYVAFTTSKQKVPDDRLNHGCTNSVDGLFSFYLFLEARKIGAKKNGENFCFDLNTFIFFKDNIRRQEINAFLKYGKSGVKVSCHLDDSEFQRLMKCLKNSNHLKRVIKRALGFN